MSDVSMLLSYLPDFSAWWQNFLLFAGNNLQLIIIGVLALGWLLHVLIIKWSLKIVFGTMWWGIKRLAYWLSETMMGGILDRSIRAN